jgi:hypothetical protein
VFPERGYLKRLHDPLLDNIKEIRRISLVEDEITFVEVVRLCDCRYLVQLSIVQTGKGSAMF